MPELSATVPPALQQVFAGVSGAAVAFSGGVDSAYLLYAAARCGVPLRAYFVKTAFQPQFELVDARRLADQLHLPLWVLPVDILSLPAVAANPADRCYHCKRALFSTILRRAAQDGCHLVWDGTNADDDAADRPGMRALAELQVQSPLRAAGLTKAEIRAYSRAAGLFTWDKPAYACLATRVPTGQAITAADLAAVDAAEEALRGMGFSDLRVRLYGPARTARIQLPAAQLAGAVACRGEILHLLAPWFDTVLLDLKAR